MPRLLAGVPIKEEQGDSDGRNGLARSRPRLLTCVGITGVAILYEVSDRIAS